jgi:hypothetical protein
MLKTLSIGFLAALASWGAERATITGTVVDQNGQPVDHATVLVWHAGVKTGYSTFCPSCYVDCGKRAFTSNGAYTIRGLDGDLKFQLLVVREGYIPLFVGYFDPANGPAPAAKLLPRLPAVDPARVVRGRVVTASGRPVADAVVEPQGVSYDGPRGEVSAYGTVAGLEPIGVTNANGEFDLTFDKAAHAMVVQVEARGMAPGLFNTLSTGLDRKTVTVTEGAVIRGRVVRDGKPVSGAEVGLIAQERGFGAKLKIVGFPHGEIRVGTAADGTFAITNVPPGVNWFVYGRLGSVAGGGAPAMKEIATKRDGEEVDAGDFAVTPGHRLRGQVVLADGKPIPPGMRVTVGSDRKAFDTLTAVLPPDGRFEFTGLRDDDYSVSASVRGYRGGTIVPVAGDVEGIEVQMEPVLKK